MNAAKKKINLKLSAKIVSASPCILALPLTLLLILKTETLFHYHWLSLPISSLKSLLPPTKFPLILMPTPHTLLYILIH